MSNDELTHKLVALMQVHLTHMQAAIEAVTKLVNSDNTFIELMKHLPVLPGPVYDEFMANAIRHDNARDQFVKASELMKENFIELAQVILKAVE